MKPFYDENMLMNFRKKNVLATTIVTTKIDAAEILQQKSFFKRAEMNLQRDRTPIYQFLLQPIGHLCRRERERERESARKGVCVRDRVCV